MRRFGTFMRLRLIAQSRSFVQAQRPPLSAYPSSGSLPYYRLTKMRFAYKNSKNPCGSNTLYLVLSHLVLDFNIS